MTKRGLLFKLAGKNRSAQCNTKLFIVFVLLEKLFFEFMRCFLSSLNFSGKLNWEMLKMTTWIGIRFGPTLKAAIWLADSLNSQSEFSTVAFSPILIGSRVSSSENAREGKQLIEH